MISIRVRNILKNTFLFFLIFLSIYQLGRLWLIDSISRNFFYVNFGQVVTHSLAKSIIDPSRILINVDGTRFAMFYDIEETPAHVHGINIITDHVADAEYIGTHKTIDPQLIFGQRSVIFDYSFRLPISLLNIEADLEYFNGIAFVPSPYASSVIYIFILDTVWDVAAEYHLNLVIYRDLLNSIIQASHGYIEPFHYIASNVVGFDFESNIFLPMWSLENINYSMIQKVNHHFDYNDQIIFRSFVNFFDNPNEIWSGRREDAYIFGDTTQVLRYFYNNILEYISHRQVNASLTLEEEYGLAVYFINRDTMVINDFYLASFVEYENKRIFNFNYSIANFPIILSEEIRQKNGLDYAIEVTVEEGIVTRYRRIGWSFELKDIRYLEEYDAITFINSLGDYSPYNIRFGYIIDVDQIRLGWTVIEQG